MVHLSTNPSYTIGASLTIQGEELAPKEPIRVLGLQIDSRLQWGPHVAKFKVKMVTQILALGRIASSTYGPTFKKSCLIHRTLISPALTFATEITHSPKVIGRKSPGAFKATPTEVLHAETEVSLLEIYLDELQAGTRCRTVVNGADKVIVTACRRVRDSVENVQGRPRHPRTIILGIRKANWTWSHI